MESTKTMDGTTLDPSRLETTILEMILPNPKHIFLVKLANEAARTYRDSSNIRALTVYHCHLLTNGCYLSKSENPVACHSSALKLYNYLLWMKV